MCTLFVWSYRKRVAQRFHFLFVIVRADTPSVVPSSGEEGSGVVAEQKRAQPIKRICQTLFFSTTPHPSFQKEGTTQVACSLLFGQTAAQARS